MLKIYKDYKNLVLIKKKFNLSPEKKERKDETVQIF